VCISATPVGGAPQGEFYFAPLTGLTFDNCDAAIDNPPVTNGSNTFFIATCNANISSAFTFGVVGESNGVALNIRGQPGEISAQQLATYALVYPNQTYTMLFFPTYSCTASGTIT